MIASEIGSGILRDFISIGALAAKLLVIGLAWYLGYGMIAIGAWCCLLKDLIGGGLGGILKGLGGGNGGTIEV